MGKISLWGDFKVDSPQEILVDTEITEIIKRNDYSVVNFEAPVHSKSELVTKSGPNISQSEDSPKWIEKHGFNVVSIANNHTFDYGLSGYEKTRSLFSSAMIAGAGNWEEAYSCKILECSDGIRVCLICCTHYEFGVLADEIIQKNDIGCAWVLSQEIVKRIISYKNDASIDAIVVYSHGGVEYMKHPLPEWRNVYKSFIMLGADAVIASHPHVPQGWEIYEDKPIFYSLGNFCFQKEGVLPEHWNESLCCELIIEQKHQVKFQVTPIVYDSLNCKLSVNKEDSFEKYLYNLNGVLNDSEKYLDYVNKYLLKLLPQYMGQFSRSGFLYYSSVSCWLKGLMDFIKGRKVFNKAHLVNNIRCETHRWAILRAMSVKYGIR